MGNDKSEDEDDGWGGEPDAEGGADEKPQETSEEAKKNAKKLWGPKQGQLSQENKEKQKNREQDDRARAEKQKDDNYGEWLRKQKGYEAAPVKPKAPPDWIKPLDGVASKLSSKIENLLNATDRESELAALLKELDEFERQEKEKMAGRKPDKDTENLDFAIRRMEDAVSEKRKALIEAYKSALEKKAIDFEQKKDHLNSAVRIAQKRKENIQEIKEKNKKIKEKISELNQAIVALTPAPSSAGGPPPPPAGGPPPPPGGPPSLASPKQTPIKKGKENTESPKPAQSSPAPFRPEDVLKIKLKPAGEQDRPSKSPQKQAVKKESEKERKLLDEQNLLNAAKRAEKRLEEAERNFKEAVELIANYGDNPRDPAGNEQRKGKEKKILQNQDKELAKLELEIKKIKAKQHEVQSEITPPIQGPSTQEMSSAPPASSPPPPAGAPPPPAGGPPPPPPPVPSKKQGTPPKTLLEGIQKAELRKGAENKDVEKEKESSPRPPDMMKQLLAKVEERGAASLENEKEEKEKEAKEEKEKKAKEEKEKEKKTNEILSENIPESAKPTEWINALEEEEKELNQLVQKIEVLEIPDVIPSVASEPSSSTPAPAPSLTPSPTPAPAAPSPAPIPVSNFVAYPSEHMQATGINYQDVAREEKWTPNQLLAYELREAVFNKISGHLNLGDGDIPQMLKHEYSHRLPWNAVSQMNSDEIRQIAGAIDGEFFKKYEGRLKLKLSEEIAGPLSASPAPSLTLAPSPSPMPASPPSPAPAAAVDVFFEKFKNSTGIDIAAMSPEDQAKNLNANRKNNEVMEALIVLNKQSPTYLENLAKASPKAMYYILPSRLGNLLSNESVAEAIYANRLILLNYTGGDFDVFMQEMEHILSRTGRTINDLLEDPKAKSILLQSSLFRRYQEQNPSEPSGKQREQERSYERDDIEHRKKEDLKRKISAGLDYNLYTKLGISEHAESTEIKTAIKRLKISAGKNPDNASQLNGIATLAEVILLDPEIKVFYDRSLDNEKLMKNIGIKTDVTWFVAPDPEKFMTEPMDFDKAGKLQAYLQGLGIVAEISRSNSQPGKHRIFANIDDIKNNLFNMGKTEDQRAKDQEELKQKLDAASSIEDIIKILEEHDENGKEMLSYNGKSIFVKDQINAIKKMIDPDIKAKVKVTRNYGLIEKVEKILKEAAAASMSSPSSATPEVELPKKEKKKVSFSETEREVRRFNFTPGEEVREGIERGIRRKTKAGGTKRKPTVSPPASPFPSSAAPTRKPSPPTPDREAIAQKVALKQASIKAKQEQKTEAEFSQAVAENDWEKIKELCEEGKISVKEVSDNGFTLLHWAAANDHSELVDFLIEKGAFPGALDSHNLTPLHYAIGYATDETMVEKLIDANLRAINAESLFGKTPLHIAARFGKEQFVKLLLANGADVNKQDKYGNTPLHAAILRENLGAVQLLLNAGASLDVKNNSGKTPATLIEELNLNIPDFVASEVVTPPAAPKKKSRLERGFEQVKEQFKKLKGEEKKETDVAGLDSPSMPSPVISSSQTSIAPVLSSSGTLDEIREFVENSDRKSDRKKCADKISLGEDEGHRLEIKMEKNGIGSKVYVNENAKGGVTFSVPSKTMSRQKEDAAIENACRLAVFSSNNPKAVFNLADTPQKEAVRAHLQAAIDDKYGKNNPNKPTIVPESEKLFVQKPGKGAGPSAGG